MYVFLFENFYKRHDIQGDRQFLTCFRFAWDIIDVVYHTCSLYYISVIYIKIAWQFDLHLCWCTLLLEIVRYKMTTNVTVKIAIPNPVMLPTTVPMMLL